MTLINEIREKAKKNNRHIVLPEGEEDRMLQALKIIRSEGLARITLLGNKDKILERLSKLNLLDTDMSDVSIIDPAQSDKRDEYIENYYQMRKKKGMTQEMAGEIMLNPLFYGAMMLHLGEVDGAVAGAVNSTGNVMRAAFQVVGKSPDFSVVSGVFLMILPQFLEHKEHVVFFADCGIVPNPNAKQLADIALATAHTRKMIIGDEPKVAMLSYSTKGSASGELVDKVVLATKIVKERSPDLAVDGELQLDAAVIPKVAAQKAKDSKVAGMANVLIFPDLNSGNIGYKLVQRMANAMAFGPFSQGLNKPFNDLSRGCSVDDIVNVVAVTALE